MPDPVMGAARLGQHHVMFVCRRGARADCFCFGPANWTNSASCPPLPLNSDGPAHRERNAFCLRSRRVRAYRLAVKPRVPRLAAVTKRRCSAQELLPRSLRPCRRDLKRCCATTPNRIDNTLVPRCKDRSLLRCRANINLRTLHRLKVPSSVTPKARLCRIGLVVTLEDFTALHLHC